MSISRRSFLKLLGLTPAVPFLGKDVFSNISPSPTDIKVEKPVEKPDWDKPEWRLSACGIIFSVPTGAASSTLPFPYWGRIRYDDR